MSAALEIQFPSKVSMTNAEYHAHEALGSTSIKAALKSPLHFWHYKQSRRPPTQSQNFGTAVHYAILEPALFRNSVIVQPKFSGKGAYTLRDQWLTENHGKVIISQEDYDAIPKILHRVSKNKYASKLLSAGAAEESYFWKDARTGILCKCRPDFLRDDGLIVDIKTTTDASEEAFSATITKYKYHLQAHHYLSGISAVLDKKFENFQIVAIESDEPYGVQVFRVDDASLEKGEQLRNRALDRIAESYRLDRYDGYPEDIVSIGLTPWGWSE